MKISTTGLPAFIGTNSVHSEQSVAHYSNGVFKLDQISKNFVGYIYGIRALLLITLTFPRIIMRVYITRI
jgi:hypothetical protein